jgi:hypothetical protein
MARSVCRFKTSLSLIEHWVSISPPEDQLKFPEFDPIDIPSLLPNIYLLEKIEDRLKYRVSGENVNSLFGWQNTGKFLDEVVPPHLYKIVRPYFFEVLEGSVAIFGGMIVHSNKEYLEFERVLMPVRRKGQVRLLGMQSLTNTARLRDDAPPPRRQGGYTVNVMNMKTDETEEIFHEIPSRG